MSRLYLDTNIVLDLLAKRYPHYTYAALIATRAEKKELTIVTSSNSFSTAFYFISKFASAAHAFEKLRKFKVICSISTVDEQIVEKALNASFQDFEDAIQYFAAERAACNHIITRNLRDFKLSSIPVMSAEEFIKAS